MKEKLYLLLVVISTQPFFLPVLAFSGEKEGLGRHGYGSGFYFFFYVVFKVAIIIVFFWLLLRIARALEEIAKSKS